MAVGVIMSVLYFARNAGQDLSSHQGCVKSGRAGGGSSSLQAAPASAAAIRRRPRPQTQTLTSRIYAGQGRQFCIMFCQKRRAGFEQPPRLREIRRY